MSKRSPEAPTIDPRMAGLSRTQVEQMHAAARAIRDGHAARAEQLLQGLRQASGSHPEPMRLLGILYLRQRRLDEAQEVLAAALAARGDDAQTLSDLAQVHAARGDMRTALATWRQACAAAPDEPIPWFNLGRNLQLQGDSAQAVEALERACTLAPGTLPALLMLGDALAHLGRFDEATARYRAALALHPACGDAWRGLSNIKTRPLLEADRRTLQRLLRTPGVDESDHVAMAYALGKLEEDGGRYPEALAALSAANALMRRRAPWSARAFEDFVDAALAASRCLPAALDATLGAEAILIVGMPRSGSTLFEQILASHPDVEGAGELPDLGIVVQAESQRRGQAYPQWAADATADDWHRLGGEYMERTRRWRDDKPRFVDKMPENWKHVGILRAMLPGAVVIDARRDRLETAWSCFKQQFFVLPHFSCDFADLGTYVRGCERAMDVWRARAPGQVHLHRYEALIEDPDAGVRGLLRDCRLDFDPACLQPHNTRRSVRTASAAQVREPMRRQASRSALYGSLLDPLRQALGVGATGSAGTPAGAGGHDPRPGR